MKTPKEPIITVVPKSLTIFILKDEDKYSAKCIELDLITEMDHPQDALENLFEMIKEYAIDYQTRWELFSKSPNRAHHRPYIEKILQCQNNWELLEISEIQYARIQL